MGSIFANIDVWVGRTLFMPLIIRWCQQFKCSQHRLARICWFIACLMGLYFASLLVGKVIFGVLAVGWCLMASLKSVNTPELSSRWFRVVLIVAIVPVDSFQLLAAGAVWHLIWDMVVLIAEYASTIRTIPPLEDTQRSAKLARETV